MSMQNFKKELHYFGIELPKDFYAEERKNGVRVCSKSLMPVSLKGDKGIASCSSRLTQGFCMSFGNFAKKAIEISDSNLQSFCSAGSFEISNKMENGRYIAKYKGFSLGIAEIINQKCISNVPRGFQRKVINKLR